MHRPTSIVDLPPIPDAIREAVDRYLGQRCQWRALVTTGTSNGLYTASCGNRDLVLRLNADPDWAFGADRPREEQVLKSISGFDWAPDILHNDPDQGWCLMRRYQPMVTKSLTDCGRTQLLAAVRAWQLISDTAPFNYQHLRSAYQQALTTVAGSDGRLAELLMRLLVQVFDGLDSLPAVPACLVHHDLHMGNLCWDHGQLIVLDWEYAGLGNPWMDAVPLCDQLGVQVEQLLDLPAFRLLSSDRLLAGYRQARSVQQGLELLWYWVRERGAFAKDRAALLTATEKQLRG